MPEDNPYRIAYMKTASPLEKKIENRMKEDDRYRRFHQEEGLGGVDEYWTRVGRVFPKDVERTKEFARGLQRIQEEVERADQAATPPQQ